jgi:hypothetical protein
MTADTGRLHAIERWTVGLGAVLTLGAFLCFGREMGLAVSIGAGMMALNAIAMRRVGEKIWRVMRSDTAAGKGSTTRAVVLFNLKMAAVLAAVYFVVRHLHVQPVGLVVGLSAYPLAAVAVALTYVPPTPVEDHHG